LVRVLCPHCKTTASISEAEWQILASPWKVRVPKSVAVNVGCLECRETGFKGRQGIYEVMPMSENLQRFLDEKSDLPRFRKEAYKEGMHSLRLSGAQKVAAGITTMNEVLCVTPEQV
jgi:general secretion pathway protein E